MAQFVSAFFVQVAERAELTDSGWVVPPTREAFGVSEVILTLVTLGDDRRGSLRQRAPGARQPMATMGASSARPPVEPLKTASP